MSEKFNPENPFKQAQQPPNTAVAAEAGSLRVERLFSDQAVHPFEQLEWENRSAKIITGSGQAVIEQDNIEVPVGFSQLATKVVASKYFYGETYSLHKTFCQCRKH